MTGLVSPTSHPDSGGACPGLIAVIRGFDAALGRLKTVPEDRYREAAVLFG